MKKSIYVILLFLFLFCFHSCKVHQRINDTRDVHVRNNYNFDLDDSTHEKTNFSYENGQASYNHKNKMPLVSNKVIITSNDLVMPYSEKLKIVEVQNTKVIKQQNDLSEGRLVYKIPNVMRIRSTYKVFVRISKSHNTISIYDSLSGSVTTSKIPVTETMEVKLIDISPKDKKYFEIVDDNNGIQIIESGDTYTEWSWNVTPIHIGKTKLKIVISTIRNDNKKDIVYEDTVEIERDIKEQIIFFWEEYWKWIISTFMLPFALWFYKNRKNKKSKKDEEEETEEENETENEEEDGKGKTV